MHDTVRCRWLALGLWLTLFASFGQADDVRTWVDKSGKFKIEAKFIAIENGKAVLEKTDGLRVQIELDKLSPADRRLAEHLQKEKEKDEDNPFEKAKPAKPTPPAKPNVGRRGRTPPPTDAPELTEAEWSGVKQITVFGSDWRPPVIAVTDLKLSWQPRPVPLPAKADFFENITGIVASAKAKRAVVMTATERPGNKEVQGRLFVCDLDKGRMVKQFTFVGKMTPLALSNDGTYLVSRHEVFGFDNNDKVELWKVGEEVERVKHWVPAENPIQRGRDVVWAAFSEDDKTLITQVSGGNLTWWNVSELKPTQSLALGGHVTAIPGKSPDGKYLACVSNQDLIILDAASGDTVAVKATGQQMHQPKLSFSPDGKKLACTYMNKMDVYGLAEASVETTVQVNGAGGNAPCFWTSPTAVMVGAPLAYIETSMNVNVWGYDGTDKVAPLGDHGVMVIQDVHRKLQSLIPVKLPHGAAVQLVEQAKKDPSFFVLKPGTKVSVDVSGISDASIQQDAKAALEAKLEGNGNPVGSGGVTLVASMERGKDHEVSYRTFGSLPFDRGKTYTVTGWVFGLKLSGGGKTHWQSTGGNHPPHMIHLKQDESVESHLKQYNTPNANFFKYAELPKYVARAQGNDPAMSSSLRRSQVTTGGVR
jgi:hypothetical protein